MIERLKTLFASLSRFDQIVLGTIMGLLIALLAVIALGDYVGVRVLRATPQGEAHATSWITLQFSEEMDRPSVEARLHLEPEVAGSFQWNGPTLIYRPAAPMPAGDSFAVVLEPGAESLTGRQVLTEQRFDFTVRSPQVAYLAPANESPQNIWLVDPGDPDSARQVTFSAGGIFNFDASPDGTRLVYAEHNDSGTIDLHLLDLASGESSLLLACPDADCTTPAWSPDGTQIAYERMTYNTDLNLGASPTRVWLLELGGARAETPATTRPLFNDPQVVSYGPVWSPDGSRIAVYDSRSGGIMIYTFATDDELLIPTQHGSVGAFSPDGTRMAYPNLLLAEGTTRTYIGLADLDSRAITTLTDPADPIDDERAVWEAGGQTLIVARRYLDERYTPGRQLYRVAVATGDAKPLIVDAGYYHGYFEFDPGRTRLVLQRFPQPGESPTDAQIVPEIWVYNTNADSLIQVASNAFLPQWVP
jgi:dipeptidyl aminopeptidase/acylaminoacyl peptidase